MKELKGVIIGERKMIYRLLDADFFEGDYFKKTHLRVGIVGGFTGRYKSLEKGR